MSDPLETVTVGEFTAVDYGGSIAEVLQYQQLPSIPNEDGTVTVVDPVPMLRGTLYNLRKPSEYGTPLAVGVLEVMLRSWAVINATPDQRESYMAATATPTPTEE